MDKQQQKQDALQPTQQPSNSLDIQSILEKIKGLNIEDKEKALILEEIKKNIMNPSAGENQNLNNIQAKYTAMNMQQPIEPFNLMPVSGYGSGYGSGSGSGSGSHQYNPQQMNPQQMNLQQMNPQQMNPQQMNLQQMNPQSGNAMTVAHFDILKNKLDSVQFELIDLLRHVKDYTQRYMNAIRQQDLDKINEYINGLFQVDKTLRDTKDMASKVVPTEEELEEIKDANESIVSKTTSGITNFFGNIGKNMSSITGLVKSTADIANGYLTKKPEPSTSITTTTSNSNASNVSVSSIPVKVSKISNNKNIVSVDEYISNMDALESQNKIINDVVTSSANNINTLASHNNNNSITSSSTTSTTDTDKLNSALAKLNDEMNTDIENTVSGINSSGTTSGSNSTSSGSNSTSSGSNSTSSGSNSTSSGSNSTTTGSIGSKTQDKQDTQSGGMRNIMSNQNIMNINESRLTKKIRLLRLNLTKQKLQKQLDTNSITQKNKPIGAKIMANSNNNSSTNKFKNIIPISTTTTKPQTKKKKSKK